MGLASPKLDRNRYPLVMFASFSACTLLQ